MKEDMSSVLGRNRRLESRISVLLLVVLLIIALGVFRRQSDVDMSRFGIDMTTSAPLLKHVESDTQEQALDALTPDGFKKLSEIETYGAGNLYEKINGKAPLYIEAGFVKLSTQRFINQVDENLVMELYIFDMARARNAFSVYSIQKRADVEMLPDMEFAYRTSNAFYLIHGEYYIELVGFSESDELSAAMAEVARKFSINLSVHDDTGIPEIEHLPQENLIPGSIKLYLANAFGFKGFTNVFACRYKLGDEPITAFLSKRSDPQDAQTTVESYCNFLIDNDAETKPTANKTLNDIGAKVLDFYGTTEIVFAAGPFVGGVHEAEDQQAAEELAARLLETFREAAKGIE
ncbi:MAG: DUF6599 family protein [Planctomycetota bacterium]|nr:DUF6599 family protein [Planctomycetota bacterium]